MKYIRKSFFIGIVLTTIMLSCTKLGGDVYLGTWKNDNQHRELLITKAGENAYTIRSVGGFTETQTATYKNGNLMIGGFVALSYLNGKIISNGIEFEKVSGDNYVPGSAGNEYIPSPKEREAKRIADSTRLADSIAMVQAEIQRKANRK
jgi:hypothetical protein